MIICGDCREILPTLPAKSVQCCVTSPPYWGLRDYGTAQWIGGDAGCDHTTNRRNHGNEKQSTSNGTSRDSFAGIMECPICSAHRIDSQLGIEATPEEYITNMVTVFREVWRVLREDGTLWLNMGDSYATTNPAGRRDSGNGTSEKFGLHEINGSFGESTRKTTGLKPKDLCGIPWRVAFALQADGWYLRSDIIWHKPNPMPESVTDRPTKSHEYIFLLTKAERYFYDAEAIKQPAIRTGPASFGGLSYAGKSNSAEMVSGRNHHGDGFLVRDTVNRRSVWTINEANRDDYPHIEGSGTNTDNGFICPGCGRGSRDQNRDTNGLRDKLSVWTIPTQPYSEAHFATFPEEIPKLCILAGSKPGDTVLDPFAGSGTTGRVALELGRKPILIELNPEYIRLIEERTNVTPGFF